MASERALETVPGVEDPAAETGPTDQERLAADLQHLRDLLEGVRIGEARRFVKELEQRWPESERVRHYAHVLQPPKVRSRPDIPARSSEREWKWLEEHGHEYPGCWAAVHEGRLVAADPDRRVVTAKARQELGGETYVIFHLPGNPQTK
jgi:hypothetical protein